VRICPSCQVRPVGVGHHPACLIKHRGFGEARRTRRHWAKGSGTARLLGRPLSLADVLKEICRRRQ
jgi:hypothetical protein